MKKENVLCLILATCCCVVALGGAEFPDKIAVVKSGEVFKVIYDAASESVRLTIFDAKDRPVFAEKVKGEDGFIRPYNFSELPKGHYRLCVIDNTGEHWKKLDHTDKPLIANVTKIKEGGESKFLVTIPHEGVEEEIAVQIVDQNRSLVFTDRQLISDDFARVYNLKNLEGAMIQVVSLSTGQARTFATDLRKD